MILTDPAVRSDPAPTPLQPGLAKSIGMPTAMSIELDVPESTPANGR
ncbi:hypothetical protein ACFWG0_13430 [Streptomyces yangpuensis]